MIDAIQYLQRRLADNSIQIVKEWRSNKGIIGVYQSEKYGNQHFFVFSHDLVDSILQSVSSRVPTQQLIDEATIIANVSGAKEVV